MKKSITLGTLILFFVTILFFAFKPAGNDNKEYLVVTFQNRILYISNSNGIYKEISVDKSQTGYDVSQLLKYVKEKEEEGFKLKQYFTPQEAPWRATAILEK